MQRLEFADYFEEFVPKPVAKKQLDNQQAKLLIEHSFYRNIITEQGYVNMLRELGFNSTGE